MSAKETRIAIAVLRRDGRVLVRRRRKGEHLPGLWEFPGGKIGKDEDAAAAAAREAREELSVEAGPLAPLELIRHDYGDRRVVLHVFEGTCRGEPSAPDGAEWAWLTPDEVAALPVPDANRGLVARLRDASPHHEGQGGAAALPVGAAQNGASAAGPATAASRGPLWLRPIPIALLVAALALVAHLPSLRNGFVFDDHSEIEENTALRGPFSLRALLLTEYMGVQTGWYRPVPLLAQKLLFDRFGMNPLPYHALVLAGHVLLAGLLTWLLAAKYALPRGALIAGSLFAVHTVHSEVVSTAYGLKEVLAGLFSFSALAVLAGWRDGPDWMRLVRLFASGGFVFLAILSKESAAPVPVALMAADLLHGAPWPRWREAWRRNGRAVLFHGGFLTASAIAAVSMRYPVVGRIRLLIASDSVTNPIVALEQPQRLAMGLRLVARYARMVVWPVPFTVSYARGAIAVPGLFAPDVLLGGALLLALLAAVVWSYRFQPSFGAGALWAASTYALASNLLLPFSTLMSERFLYVPSLGLCLMLAPAADGLLARALAASRRGRLRAAAAVSALAAPIAAAAVLTFVRAPVFGDDAALGAASARWYPGSVTMRVGLADGLRLGGRYDEAEKALLAVLSTDPDVPRVLERLAACARSRGDRDAERGYWERAIRHPAADAFTYVGFGEFAAEEGREDEAVRLLGAAIRSEAGDPGSRARARQLRGALLVKNGRTLQGLNDLRISCSAMSGNAAACEDLGAAAQRVGDPRAAEGALRQALSLAPDRRSALGRLTRLLLEQRRGAEAIPLLERLTALDPADLRPRTDLGTAYVQARRLDDARRAFEAVLERDPGHPVALATLASICEQQGDRDDAARLYERYLATGPPEDSLTQNVRGRLDRLRRGP